MATRLAWSLGAATLVAALTAAAAAASPFTTTTPSVITGPSPFGDCSIGAGGDSVAYTNAEVEPWVAVDPTTGNAVAVWQQDRWSDGGARALGTAASSDGVSWSSLFIPWSLCAGGTPPAGDFRRVTDPWVSFGPDGIGYQVALGFWYLDESAITASRSLDGGHTWTTAQVILRETMLAPPWPFADKESVTADPTRPGYAYAVWDRIRFPSEHEAFLGAIHSFFVAHSFRADATLSRTTNGGVSWTPSRSIMPTPESNLWTIANQVAVTGNGALVDVFEFGQSSGGLYSFGALRSTDAGQSWSSRIIEIADDESVPVRDPDDGDPVRAAPFILDVASDLSEPGTLYAVWADARFSGGLRDEVAFSKSSDGGLTWSMPIKINQTPAASNPLDGQAFLPAIDVGGDGTIGVFYYDFRNNTSNPDTLPTTAFLIHSHDGGQTWEENQLAAPFDLETAPLSVSTLSEPGYFIGDYQGLAARGDGFLAAFAITNNGDLNNRTDIAAVSAIP
jgi:hypothetical protein